MSLSEDDARKIANYLFTHKWLAVAYSVMMETMLVEEMMEAVNLTADKVNGKDDGES